MKLLRFYSLFPFRGTGRPARFLPALLALALLQLPLLAVPGEGEGGEDDLKPVTEQLVTSAKAAKPVQYSACPEDVTPPVLINKIPKFYIFAAGPSLLEISLPEGASRFTAIGISTNETKGNFIVICGGKTVFKKAAERGAPRAVDITLPKGAKSLTLKVEGKLHSFWCLPRLEFAAAP